MGQTVVGLNDPRAVKKWSSTLAAEIGLEDYWSRFTGPNDNAVIQYQTDLESGAGDRLSFDLSLRIRGEGVAGDERVDGTAENLRLLSDEVRVDQYRKQVSAGGTMTRKRTLHNLRTVAKDRLKDWWREYMEQVRFIYLSGARGINANFIVGTDWAGHAGNNVEAPDGDHILFGGAAVSKATLTEADKMSRTLVERAAVQAEMLQEVNPDCINMQPTMVDGAPHYVMVMNPWQTHDMRQEAGSAGWMELQKAAATALGASSPIFKGGLGMIKNVVLHEHRWGIRFGDYGAGRNVQAARALLLGRQAGVMAYGSANRETKFNWVEELKDAGNEPVFTGGLIYGFKKTKFANRDLGVIAVDTAAKNPNPKQGG
ncbi:N4-gp56 family major capsid protein [Chromobacterium vaccinii]|uniref:N4-gp56 family major capsid protein n=1 Tax=Chromobacterium vaccinii TaxID=1108595 RepID=UPI0031E01ACE